MEKSKSKPVTCFHEGKKERDVNSNYYFFFNLVTSIYTARHMELELVGGKYALKIAPCPEEKCDLKVP